MPDYKEMIVDSTAADIVYSSLFTGVHGNYLEGSIAQAGMDPDNCPRATRTTWISARPATSEAKAWKDIWGAGQGVGNIDDILPARDVVSAHGAASTATRWRA